MVKIGMLLPEERMVEPARKIIEENHLDVVYLEDVHTVDAVNKARIAVEAGAHILVARGYQAKLKNIQIFLLLRFVFMHRRLVCSFRKQRRFLRKSIHILH